MIIIGEKINGAIPSVAQAIRERDVEKIQGLVKNQEACGADYLDVCAGTSPDEELDAMIWLLDTVQAVATKPLSVDSPNPDIILEVLQYIKQPGIINSISLEGSKCEKLLPFLKGNPDWKVIALTCDNDGIPAAAEKKIALVFDLIKKCAMYEIDPSRIHIDPLVLALSAVNDAALQFRTAIIEIKKCYPTVNITAALSNISFGMPARRIINQNFLAMAMYAGLDSGILDPMNRDIVSTIFAVDALMGRDRNCRKYNKAYRAGKIGPVKK